MSTMNISLPDALRAFVDEQVHTRGFSTSSEYVRELIRREQERLRREAQWLDALDASLERSLTDADAGRIREAREVFDRLEAKYAAMADKPGDR